MKIMKIHSFRYFSRPFFVEQPQESSCCACCRRIRARFYRLEGEVLASDPPEFESARYWLAHPLHHPRPEQMSWEISWGWDMEMDRMDTGMDTGIDLR